MSRGRLSLEVWWPRKHLLIICMFTCSSAEQEQVFFFGADS